MRTKLNDFMANFEEQRGDYYGFYDWFCTTKSLRNRAKTFLPKLRFLLDQGILNGETTYVWFKNNCPLVGDLYDDMRFSLIEDENTYLGGIAPAIGYAKDNGMCDIWFYYEGSDNRTRIERFKNWRALKSKIANDAGFREELKAHFYR